MSKTSRVILWCVLIAVLAMCIVLYIAAKRPIEDTAYRNAGKTYAESQQPGDETLVITGGDFTMHAKPRLRHDGGCLLGLHVRDTQAYAHARKLHTGAGGGLPCGGAHARRGRCVA